MGRKRWGETSSSSHISDNPTPVQMLLSQTESKTSPCSHSDVEAELLPGFLDAPPTWSSAQSVLAEAPGPPVLSASQKDDRAMVTLGCGVLHAQGICAEADWGSYKRLKWCKEIRPGNSQRLPKKGWGSRFTPESAAGQAEPLPTAPGSRKASQTFHLVRLSS